MRGYHRGIGLPLRYPGRPDKVRPLTFDFQFFDFRELPLSEFMTPAWKAFTLVAREETANGFCTPNQDGNR